MIAVRRANRDDLAFIVDAQMAMAAESEGAELDRAILTQGVRAVLEDRAHADYWLAEEDEAPVGMLMTVTEWSDWRNGTVLWIHSVYVMPEARRRGVYSTLYEHLRAQVERSDELVGLRLYVGKGNEPAQRTYEALGMTRDHYHLYEWLKP